MPWSATGVTSARRRKRTNQPRRAPLAFAGLQVQEDFTDNLDYASNATNERAGSIIGGMAASQRIDRRPLEEITDLADDLGRMNEGLKAFLIRSNGPQPAPIIGGERPASGPPPMPCYRSEIERLVCIVTETGSLVDAVNRLG